MEQKDYIKTPIGRALYLLCGYRKQDKRNGFDNVIDFDAKWIVENIFSKSCPHCGETDWTKIGCNRLDNSKGHTKDNVEPCCTKCNISLGAIESNSKQVCQYTLDNKLVKVWKSMAEAQRNGFSAGGICKACKGKYLGSNIYKGFKWSY